MQSTPLETQQGHPTNLKSFHKYQVTSTPKAAPCHSEQTSLNRQSLPMIPSSAIIQFGFHSGLKPILKCILSSHIHWVCLLETSFCSLDLFVFSRWLYWINSTVCTTHNGVHSSPLFVGFLFSPEILWLLNLFFTVNWEVIVALKPPSISLLPPPNRHTNRPILGEFYWEKVQRQKLLGVILSFYPISSLPENMASLSTYSNLFYVPY